MQLLIVAFLGHTHSLYKSKSTVLSAKSDSDFMFCLQSYQGLISIDHLCINPILSMDKNTSDMSIW